MSFFFIVFGIVQYDIEYSEWMYVLIPAADPFLQLQNCNFLWYDGPVHNPLLLFFPWPAHRIHGLDLPEKRPR